MIEASSSETRAGNRTKSSVADGLVGGMLAVVMVGAVILAGCGTPPRASNTAACTGRARIQTAVTDLNQIDYSNLDAGQLHTALASLQQGVTEAEAAVNLRQNSDLRQLGGLSYLRTLNGHLETLLGEASRAGSNPGSVDITTLKTDVAAQAQEGQRIVDAIKGC